MGSSSKLQQNGGRGTQECHKKPVICLPSLHLSLPPLPHLPSFPTWVPQLINTHTSRGFPDQFH